MANLGDIIIAARDLFPDPCGSLQPPTFVAAPFTTGKTIYPFPANGSATVGVTMLNQWGETTSQTVITVTATAPFDVNVSANGSHDATAWRIYFGANSNLLDRFIEVPASFFADPSSIVTSIGDLISTTINGYPLAIQNGYMPVISRAWLPDTDGAIISASGLYRWIRDGLALTGDKTGGIRDITGFPTIVGQPVYPIVGNWQQIDNNFYQGYPVIAGRKQQIFRRSPVRGLSGMTTVNVSADRQFVELWPQPNQTSGTGTLTAALPATLGGPGATFSVTNPSGWVLGFGLMLIGQYPPTRDVNTPANGMGVGACELVYYGSFGGGIVNGVARGMGGTVPQNWPIGTPVYECTVYMTGLRNPQVYYRGQAASPFTCPPGYEEALQKYLIHRFKLAEQDLQSANGAYQAFSAQCDQINGERQFNGPRQVQISGEGGVEVAAGLGSPFGRIIIPALLLALTLPSGILGPWHTYMGSLTAALGRFFT